jgi:cytochrome P450
MRGIVSKAFTPKNIALMQDQITRAVRGVVDEVAPLGEGDLGQLITKQVPGRVFAGFFGITDPEQVRHITDVAEQMGAWADPEYAHIGSPLMVFADAAAKLGGLALDLAKQRQENPTEDLMSWVSQAQYEGQKMTVEEVGVFFTLLAGAANDTTRHSMSRILGLFAEHPDQLAYLFEDFENRVEDAVNECLRYEPPLMHFRRTAVEDYELGGQLIKAGDKVVMWYVSGNRDDEVFPDADRFDVSRPWKQNPHQAFGGGGPHYCLGNMLGRQVLRSEIWEIYTRMKDLDVRLEGPILSNFMNGVKRVPATWTPTSR